MKKLFGLFLCLSLIIGCTDDQTVEIIEEDQQVNESEQIFEEENKQDEDKAIEEKEVEIEPQKEGLLNYRPKVPSKAIYTDNGEELYRYNIIAENEEYVQLTVTIGFGTPTTQIYKWTATEITLVYESTEEVVETKRPMYSDSNLLDDLELLEISELETLIHLERDADWQLISETESVTVPYGTFSDIYVVEKVTDEVANAETIYRKYFAPGVGLIKQTFEVTGENGYFAEASLEVIQ